MVARLPSRRLALAAAVLAAGGALGAARLVGRAPDAGPAASAPVWTETAWPFPLDPWGAGKAYRCRADHCGARVTLYLRAKLGFCGCATTLDDDDVARVSDLDLVAPERAALGPGRAVAVRTMTGRSRRYALGAGAGSALAMAFHERCDTVVATAVLDGDEPGRQEEVVLEFLGGATVLRWAEATLGL
ncbi:hypothetical protein OPKNFCMD_5872 [Methylobacterium crusticola]|uniref:Uncharacterized protein n=1 Tax=Methylobacterium crusticola TaxID=1697972 RepID=A0ABQ4R5Y6_9HYPH|nr:hypothetical protein [Methylobacterium crusticola]GJD53101.1 hypothetical protein OPKNFCMD_5872 [Methylobacterium crusticola]